MEVWKIIFFLNGWFVGSMLIFQGVDFSQIVFFCLSFQMTFFVGGFCHCLLVATQLFDYFYADPEMKWSNSTSICFGWVVQTPARLDSSQFLTLKKAIEILHSRSFTVHLSKMIWKTTLSLWVLAKFSGENCEDSREQIFHLLLFRERY